MIKIVGVRKPEVSYTLIEGKTYEIGRREGDITFPDDQSISRHHGQIAVDHPIANITNVALIPNVCVTDLGSKFGTFVNDGIERKTTLSVREKMNLSAGDRFKFGLQWNEFRIEYTPMITTSSAVKDIQSLKKTICKLGAHLLPEWTDKCDFVIMESITLTIKAVCALLSAKRIVTPAYFKDLLECHITGKTSLPNPSDFLPELAEKTLRDHNVSFEPNNRRSKVFEDKIFMFVNSKHLRKLAVAVESGGGTTCLVTSATTADLKSPKSVLMAMVVDNSSLEKSTLDSIESYKKCGKRAIPESEIGLAALHCSTEKHCNPLYSFNKAVLTTPRMISQTQASTSSSNASFLPVPETQDMVTQRSVESHSIDVVEETMISTSSGNKTSSSSVDDISIDNGNPGPSRKSQYSKKRQDDDIQELPTSKRRLPKEAEFLEPSIKKARKEPITSNKTLSNLFDSSSDEDEDAVKVEEKIVESNPSETMDVDQENQDNIVDDQIKVPSENAELNDDIVPSTPATVDRTINPTPLPCDTQEDLFPTDGPSVSAKRKLEEEEEDDAPKTKAKARKVTNASKKEVILDKIKKLDISKKSAATKYEIGSEASNDDVVQACPTFFVKQVLLERQPPVGESNKKGEIVNYKRFKKVTPLNSSCADNSLLEESVSIRLVLDGEENCSISSTFSKNTGKGNTNSVNATNHDQDQSELFEDISVPISIPQQEPTPSTSRRTTRSGGMSPPKPVSSRANKPSKPADEKSVNESQVDFERHVEGGTRLTRSRSGNVPGSPPKPIRKQKKEEIQDMWTF